jgi:hypothetical protein
MTTAHTTIHPPGTEQGARLEVSYDATQARVWLSCAEGCHDVGITITTAQALTLARWLEENVVK